MRLDELEFVDHGGRYPINARPRWRVATIHRVDAPDVLVYQPTETNKQQQSGHYAVYSGSFYIGGRGAFTCIPPLQAQAIILGILDGSIET